MMAQSARGRAAILRAGLKSVPAPAPPRVGPCAPRAFVAMSADQSLDAVRGTWRSQIVNANSTCRVNMQQTATREMSILASRFQSAVWCRAEPRKEQRGLAKKKGKKGKGEEDEEDGDSGKKKKGGKKGKSKDEEELDADIDVQAEIKTIISDLDAGMKEVLSHLDDEFSKFRTGRADPRMLDRVRVKQHAVEVQLSHVAQVFDPDLVSSVDKALRTSGLDINPVVAGQTIRIPIPKMTQETRTKLAKQAAQLGESAKVRARRVRHTGLEKGNKLKLPKDEQKKFEKEVQAVTDVAVKEVDGKVKVKQTELKNE